MRSVPGGKRLSRGLKMHFECYGDFTSNNALGFLNRVAAELDVPNEGWSSVGI
jgi:hypothetical protein